MFRILRFTVLIIFSLALTVSGCGVDEDEPLTSIDIPIHFAPSFTTAFAQQSAKIDITITGTGITNPISTTRFITISSERSGYTTVDMTVPNVPVGKNRRVAVDVSIDGEVRFTGITTVDLSGGGSNRVTIPLRRVGPDITPLSESIIGTWWLTNTVAAGSFLTFNRDGTFVFENAIAFFPGEYVLDGDALTVIFANDNLNFAAVRIIDDQMTLSYLDGLIEIYQRQ